MAKPRDERQKDLFRPPLDRIIDLGHPLVRLTGEIDWGFLERRFSAVCTAGPGQPLLPAWLVAGLFILKHMHGLSDEALCARWLKNLYYQFFCGEQTFRHELPFERSSLTRWRQRLGEAQLVALMQGSLAVAHKTRALAASFDRRSARSSPTRATTPFLCTRRALIPAGLSCVAAKFLAISSFSAGHNPAHNRLNCRSIPLLVVVAEICRPSSSLKCTAA